MTHDKEPVRNKLIEITGQGLLLKAIAVNVGISENDLSKFKNGMDNLKESNIEVLSEYLNEVVIPQWNRVPPETKPKVKRRQVSLDLLRSLD